MMSPSATVVGAMRSAVGATLATATEPSYTRLPPSLSVTLPCTNRAPLSVVAQLVEVVKPAPSPQS